MAETITYLCMSFVTPRRISQAVVRTTQWLSECGHNRKSDFLNWSCSFCGVPVGLWQYTCRWLERQTCLYWWQTNPRIKIFRLVHPHTHQHRSMNTPSALRVRRWKRRAMKLQPSPMCLTALISREPWWASTLWERKLILLKRLWSRRPIMY